MADDDGFYIVLGISRMMFSSIVGAFESRINIKKGHIDEKQEFRPF